MSTQYFMGVDIGQMQDYTALAVVEQVRRFEARKALPGTPAHELEPRYLHIEYHLRHLERPRLGTPYPMVTRRIKTLLLSNELRDNCELIVDATGVGKPVVDMLLSEGLTPIPVTITGANEVVAGSFGYHVPKRDLVGALQVVFQSERLRIAQGLVLSEVFRKELEYFRVKITQKAHDTYEAWREGEHDDLVLAAAIAVWYASREDEHGSKYFEEDWKYDEEKNEYDVLGRD